MSNEQMGVLLKVIKSSSPLHKPSNSILDIVETLFLKALKQWKALWHCCKNCHDHDCLDWSSWNRGSATTSAHGLAIGFILPFSHWALNHHRYKSWKRNCLKSSSTYRVILISQSISVSSQRKFFFEKVSFKSVVKSSFGKFFLWWME